MIEGVVRWCVVTNMLMKSVASCGQLGVGGKSIAFFYSGVYPLV